MLLGSTDRRLEGLRGSHGGHRGAGVAGGEKTGGGPNSPTAALRRNSGAVEVRGRGQRLGELLGLEVELLCGSGEAAARRSDGISAAWWFCSGAEGAGVALGCRGGGGVARVGLREGRGVLK